MTRPLYLADEVRARLAQYEVLRARVAEVESALNKALDLSILYVKQRDAALARVAKLEAALLDVRERVVGGEPCWCVMDKEPGDEHAEYCIAARLALAPRSERREGVECHWGHRHGTRVEAEECSGKPPAAPKAPCEHRWFRKEEEDLCIDCGARTNAGGQPAAPKEEAP